MPRPSRTRIAFAVAGSIVPAALLAAVMVGYDYYQRERARIIQDTTGTARALVAGVDGKLRETEAVLAALAASPALLREDFAAFHAQAAAVSTRMSYSNIVVIDAAGPRQRLNTLIPPGQPLRLATHPVLIGIARDGKPAITEVFQAPVVKRWVVGVGIPLRGPSGASYSLNAGLPAETLAPVLARQQLPQGWVAVILDATGAIVSRTRGAERFVGAKAAPALLEKLKEPQPEGALETETVDGTPVLSVYSRSPGTGWTVAIGVPRAELLRHLWFSMARLAIIAFVLLATALALALWIGSRTGDEAPAR